MPLKLKPNCVLLGLELNLTSLNSEPKREYVMNLVSLKYFSNGLIFSVFMWHVILKIPAKAI